MSRVSGITRSVEPPSPQRVRPGPEHAGKTPTKQGGFRQKAGELRQKISASVKRILARQGQSTPQAGAGNKSVRTEGDNATDSQKAAQNRNDPESQHSPEGRARDKNNFMDNVKKGAVLGLAMLPMAFLLASAIQGGIDCDNINHMDPGPVVTNIDSAAWPDYPDWWPDWIPAPQADKNKVWLSYSPAVHLLMTDTITVKTSNTSGNIETSVTGQHSVENNEDDATVLIQIAKDFDPKEDFSNVTMTLDISTNCIDRMAYQAGQNTAAVASATGNVLGNFLGSTPWRAILLVLVFIFAFWILYQGIQYARS